MSVYLLSFYVWSSSTHICIFQYYFIIHTYSSAIFVFYFDNKNYYSKLSLFENDDCHNIHCYYWLVLRRIPLTFDWMVIGHTSGKTMAEQ